MHVVLAGGGVGGMTAALALLQRGVQVTVLEQARELTEVGAGIQISPNGNRALDHLGVFEALRARSCDPVRKEFRLWNTGRPVADVRPRPDGGGAVRLPLPHGVPPRPAQGARGRCASRRGSTSSGSAPGSWASSRTSRVPRSFSRTGAG